MRKLRKGNWRWLMEDFDEIASSGRRVCRAERGEAVIVKVKGTSRQV